MVAGLTPSFQLGDGKIPLSHYLDNNSEDIDDMDDGSDIPAAGGIKLVVKEGPKGLRGKNEWGSKLVFLQNWHVFLMTCF